MEKVVLAYSGGLDTSIIIPYLKEKYLRDGKVIPRFGPGLQIFNNGVNYFK